MERRAREPDVLPLPTRLMTARTIDVLLKVRFQAGIIQADLAPELHQVKPSTVPAAVSVAVDVHLMPECQQLADRVDRQGECNFGQPRHTDEIGL